MLPATPDCIVLDRVRLHAFHGVLPQERIVGGYYDVSVRAYLDLTRSAVTDCVDDTVSYADILDDVRREMATPSHLVEHVAARIANAVLDHFQAVTAVHVAVVKLNPPMGAQCAGAGVEITRFRTNP